MSIENNLILDITLDLFSNISAAGRFLYINPL